ncbi:hypothetical protein F5148DRAFT_1256053, partial [Russula earlei]
PLGGRFISGLWLATEFALTWVHHRPHRASCHLQVALASPPSRPSTTFSRAQPPPIATCQRSHRRRRLDASCRLV